MGIATRQQLLWARETNRKGPMVDNLVSPDQERRQKIECALNESKRQFRLLVESVVDYTIGVDDRAPTWNSDGAARIKDYSAETIGHDHSAFYTDEDCQRRPGADTQAREQGRQESEGWRVRKYGSRSGQTSSWTPSKTMRAT